MMDQIADKPVINEKDDYFNRYNFAKSIAQTVMNLKNNDALVFGIYGTWGEGKTSVINFIKNEISTNSTNYIQFVFNPWRFSDETTLLASFFNKLAFEILDNQSSKINKSKMECFLDKLKFKQKPLKSKKEFIGDNLQKYADLIGIGPIDKITKGVGKVLSGKSDDIDELKKRIESIVNEQKTRIIIYIDDIDRLDKAEIYSIFKLVKLTADFSFITYFLAFDPEIVASAIGEKFSSGDKIAGYSFLEKIVQIPLIIPKAQPNAFTEYCFEHIYKALDINNIILDENEIRRLYKFFIPNVIPMVKTPRQAIRFGNSLSLILSLLNGEANIVDLIFIEAIRIFYPEHYKFIKDNSYFFIPIDSDMYSADKNINNKLKEYLEKQGQDENSIVETNKYLLNLICHLFPKINFIDGRRALSNSQSNEWYLNKRICSPDYFDRYFSYSVIKGDFSDYDFRNLVDKIKNNNSIEDTSEYCINILQRVNPNNFIYKLNINRNDFNWEEGQLIIKVLGTISNLLEDDNTQSFFYSSPLSQTVIFIYHILLKNNKENDILDFAKELMLNYAFNFSYETYHILYPNENDTQHLFDNSQYEELAIILANRALNGNNANSIFEAFSEYIPFLVKTLYKSKPILLMEHLERFVSINANNVIVLIKSFLPTIRSSDKPTPYIGDLEQRIYNNIVSSIKKEWLIEKIKLAYPNNELENEELFWVDRVENNFTDLNMLRQFLYWSKQDSEIIINN